jgi:hypothetical protein
LFLDFANASWKKSGRCDNSGPNCVEVAFVEGGVGVRDSKSPDNPLAFTTDEWDTFVAGAKAGDFDL